MIRREGKVRDVYWQSAVSWIKQQAAVFTDSVKQNSNYSFYADASLFTLLL